MNFFFWDGPYPQYGWDFPEEIPEKFRKDPGNALRAFPGIPLESTAGIPPNPISQGHVSFFGNGSGEGPLRANHGIPSSTGGISE